MVNVREKNRIILIAPTYDILPTYQLGLLYIASYLREKGYHKEEIKVIIASDFSPGELRAWVSRQSPRVLGIHCNSDNVYTVKRIANTLKSFSPRSLVVIGGPHASLYDRDLLASTKADIIVRGEGEITFHEIADHFFQNKNTLEEIQGITYREKEKIKRNPDRPFIRDPGKLPFPDRSFLDPAVRSKHTAVITGRGCPHQCAFCFESFHGKKYRVRDIDDVINEIKYLHRDLGYQYISIVDDTFVDHPERVKTFCRKMKETFNVGEELIWFALGRVDTLSRNLSLIEEMKEAGMVRLQIGIESGNQHQLDIYKKNINTDQVRQVVKECEETGLLSLFGNFIIGNPFETEATFQKSLDFALELMETAPGRMECSAGYLTPYPGTAIRKNPKKFGIDIIYPNLETGTAVRFPFCQTPALSKEKLIQFHQQFEEEINKKMLSLIPTLPTSLITRHLDCLKFDLETEWAVLFQKEPLLRLFHQISQTAIYVKSEGHTFEQMKHLVPVFIGELNIRDKSCFFSCRFRLKHLNEWGMTVVRLCRGKLSLIEVVDRFSRIYEGDLPEREVLAIHLFEFMQKLEKINALVFLQI